MQPKKVLVITFAFPPMPQVASLRMKGLANYLGEFGWEPYFLTAAPPDASNLNYNHIYVPFPGTVVGNLCQKLNFKKSSTNTEQKTKKQNVFYERDNLFVQKLANLFNSFVAYPDHFRLWLPPAVKVVEKLIKKEKFDAVINSSPPVMTNLIAAKLKRKFGLPWIADFRDLWSQNPYYPYIKLRQHIDRKLEKRVLAKADALVTVSEPLAQQLRQLHNSKPVKTITNGFDPNEIIDADLEKKFTIIYAGKFYQGKRDPAKLFVALKELIDENKISKKNLQVNFYGPMLSWIDCLIKKNELQSVVKQCGFVERDTVMKKQRESQMLLLLNGSS
ncbi:MAG: glycosyltransferase, partial [Candidatus Rifleibacteriota bacterium]